MILLIVRHFFVVLVLFLASTSYSQSVKLGADLLFSENIDLVKNKSVGVITNHTALLKDGTHLVDTLINRNDVKLAAIFGPEHGLKGNAPDGESIEDDSKLHIPIYSLYGKVNKPTKEMLNNIDVLLFDIQDIGARYYTYISTLFTCIEAAAENNIPIVVLDRPNPINGITVDGPLRDEEFKSFVAIAPIPIVHGMTIGELALLFNEERYIESPDKADLKIVKMKNWKREFFYDECGLSWVKPSPNMPKLETAILYPGMCLLEGVNISEGRGTFLPFEQIGAPFINGQLLADEIQKMELTSISVTPVEFNPVSIDTMSKYPKYLNEKCFGIRLKILDRHNFESLRFGIELLHVLKRLYPNDFKYRKNWLDKLYGSEELKISIDNNSAPGKLFDSWTKDLDKFKEVRKRYLFY